MAQPLSIPTKANIKDPDLLQAFEMLETHVPTRKSVEETTLPRPTAVNTNRPNHSEGKDGDLTIYQEDGDLYLTIKVNGRHRRIAKLEEL